MSAEELRKTQLPAAFVEALSGMAYQTLREWLEANAPKKVASLFFNYEGLTTYLHQIATDAPAQILENFGIAEVAINAITEIDALGGAFRSSTGEEIRTTNMLRKGGAA